MNDSATGRSRGFGFVTYKAAQVAKDMISQGPHILDGRTIDPKISIPRGQPGVSRAQTRRVFSMFIVLHTAVNFSTGCALRAPTRTLGGRFHLVVTAR